MFGNGFAPGDESVVREVSPHHIEVFMNPPHVSGDVANTSIDPVQRGGPWPLSSIRHHEVNAAQIASSVLSQKQAPGVIYGYVKLKVSSLRHVADVVPKGTADLSVSLPGPSPQFFEFEAPAGIGPLTESKNDGGLSAIALAKPSRAPVFASPLATHQDEPSETNPGDKLTIVQPGLSARVSRAVRATVPAKVAYRQLVEEAVAWTTDAHGGAVAAIVYRRVVVEIVMSIPGELDEFFGSASTSTRHYNHPLGYTPGGE